MNIECKLWGDAEGNECQRKQVGRLSATVPTTAPNFSRKSPGCALIPNCNTLTGVELRLRSRLMRSVTRLFETLLT